MHTTCAWECVTVYLLYMCIVSVCACAWICAAVSACVYTVLFTVNKAYMCLCVIYTFTIKQQQS